jgi:hypothetical protein
MWFYQDEDVGHPLALCGFVLMVPACMVFIVGRDNIFNFVARNFDRDPAQRERDGAFIASLLDSVPASIGDTWWVHHGQNDHRFPLHDPNRNWDKGMIVEVTSFDFVVKILPGIRGPSVHAPSTWQSVRSSILSDTGMGSRIIRVPTMSSQMSVEDVLTVAKRGLRCIEWEALKHNKDALMSNVGEDPALDASEFYGFSRPVRPGEAIDFFLSNSWHDDKDAKWKKLVEIATDFHLSHGRYPTFWLDKVCIDQSRINDCLKVLPVNVMACHRLLALCGHTYMDRLWCVWELFTLFSFSREDLAMKRIKLVALEGTSGQDVLTRLSQFDADSARCYDPNEQAKLMQVIDAVGKNQFNRRVRRLAMLVRV